MKRSPFLACSLVSLCAPCVWAQDAVFAVPGSRVRVTMAAEAASRGDRAVLRPGAVGTLVRVEDETLTLRVDGTEQTLGVARRSIVKFEVSAGKRSRTKNALVGAGFGVGFAAVFLLSYFGGDALEDEAAFATSTIMVATMTVPMCALIGAVLPTPERWKELPVDRVQVSVAPLPGRGVAVSLRFGF